MATFEVHSNLDAKEFVVLLLRLRLLFDRYLIKREWDKDWSLKRLQWYVIRADTTQGIPLWLVVKKLYYTSFHRVFCVTTYCA